MGVVEFAGMNHGESGHRVTQSESAQSLSANRSKRLQDHHAIYNVDEPVCNLRTSTWMVVSKLELVSWIVAA